LLCILDCKVLRKDVNALGLVVPPKVDIKLEKLDCSDVSADELAEVLVVLAVLVLTELIQLTESAADGAFVTDEVALFDAALSCEMRLLSSVENCPPIARSNPWCL
jgi:hypothetical protein